MSPSILFIHGLNSSRYAFSFLAKELGTVATIDYASHQALSLSVQQVMKQLPKDEPIILVGHSLGGIIAVMIAHLKAVNIQKIVTISSPFGGSKVAALASYFLPGQQILADITPRSIALRGIETAPAPCPVLSIISTGGGLNGGEPNDSIVSIESQYALPYGQKIEIKANHFLVLMHGKTIEAIRKFVL